MDIELNYVLILALTPIITGIVQSFKLVGLPSRFSPIASIAVGMGIVYGFAEPGLAIRSLLLSGVVAGLTASGLYAGSKAMAPEKQEAVSEPETGIEMGIETAIEFGFSDEAEPDEA